MKFLRSNHGSTSPLRNALVFVILLSLVQLWLSGQATTSLSSGNGHSRSAPSSRNTSGTGSRLQFSRPCNSKCTLPEWMQNYTRWHTRRLQEILNHPPSEQPWSRHNLLVVRCLKEDRCGGTADRLKCLPLYLAVAAKTRRLLFLRWTRPFRLEEFMVPTKEFNWTVPDSLASLLDSNTDSNTTTKVFFGGKALNQMVKSAHKSNIWLVEAAAQFSGGDLFRHVVTSMQGNAQMEISTPPEFFHEMFLAFFQPAPALYTLVEHQMQKLDLWPNRFVTAHIRAKYPGEPYRENWNVTLLQQSVRNAVDCASSLVPAMNLPVYVASDTLVSLQAAQKYGRNSTPYRVVSLIDVPNSELSTQADRPVLPHQDPPHLNFAHEEDPSAFFSIFADLFIMSQSRCVSFGAGGFGRFGSLVSFNTTCQVAHSTNGKPNKCSAVGANP